MFLRRKEYGTGHCKTMGLQKMQCARNKMVMHYVLLVSIQYAEERRERRKVHQYYTQRVIAFIDILGFKNHVRESLILPEKARQLHCSLQRIYQMKQENDEIQSITSLKEEGVEVSVFSDSAVISYPVTMEGGLFYILLDLIHLQIDLAAYGILVRGGIALGEVYHDGNILYGPAMVEAYELELCEAVYPRIVVKRDTLLRGIETTYASQNGIRMEAEYIDSCVQKDEAQDDLYYLDFLRQDQELIDVGDEYFRWLKVVRKMIVQGLNLSIGNQRVFSKYAWLRRYFNEVVTDKNASFPVPEYLDKQDSIRFFQEYGRLQIKRRRAGERQYL